MQTLIPQPVTATARPNGRWGRVLGFGLTARALLLLLAGVQLSIPAFFHAHRIWMMVAWDASVLALIAWNVTAHRDTVHSYVFVPRRDCRRRERLP